MIAITGGATPTPRVPVSAIAATRREILASGNFATFNKYILTPPLKTYILNVVEQRRLLFGNLKPIGAAANLAERECDGSRGRFGNVNESGQQCCSTAGRGQTPNCEEREMTEQQSTLAENAMQVVRLMALKRRFSEEEVFDAISIAWEIAQIGHGSPHTVAWYAILRVRSARRFHGESIRSIDSMKPAPDRPRRSVVDLKDLARPGTNPAELAAFRLDFSEWLESLPDRPRRVADALASGEKTGDLAKTLGCSAGRVSQIRRELEACWLEFQS